MKICKYCKKEIDSKARICPYCQKRQNSHKIRWFFLAIIAIIIIGTIMNKSDDENFVKEYSQKDIVTYKDVNYSITKVEKTKGTNQFFKAKDGYEYVKVTIKIENKSDKKQSYNALSFRMANGDGVESSTNTITAEEDIQLHSGDLDPGGIVEGVIIWEQKQGETGLKVRYYKTALTERNYTFQWTLD